MQIRDLQKEILDCQENIRKQQSERMNLRLASDYFRGRAEKYEVLGQLPQSKKTS